MLQCILDFEFVLLFTYTVPSFWDIWERYIAIFAPVNSGELCIAIPVCVPVIFARAATQYLSIVSLLGECSCVSAVNLSVTLNSSLNPLDRQGNTQDNEGLLVYCRLKG